MLKEYFSLEISDSGHIVSLPLLLESFTPNLDKLPMFLLHLATEVRERETVLLPFVQYVKGL